MAFHRTVLLELNGLDGRIQPAAEDSDLSYRRIRYEPDFAASHHDWRSRQQLDRLYVNCGMAQGKAYGKHLWRGDLVVASHLASPVASGLRNLFARMNRRRRRNHGDPRLRFGRGLPVGIVRS